MKKPKHTTPPKKDKLKKQFNFKKLILVLGIILILNLFVNYGVATFYDAPNYEDYCTTEITSKDYSTEEACEKTGGLWNEAPRIKETVPRDEIQESWCDEEYTCAKDYGVVKDVYNRDVFIILIIAGIISILVGFFATQAEAVSIGLSFGGLLSLIIGTMRYWSGMDDYLRFIILGVALAILIWIGVKKLKD